MQRKAIAFVPEEYLDEIPPEGKQDINDWIGATSDGLFFLKPCGDPDYPHEWGGRRLADGEIVTFTWFVAYGDATVNWDGAAALADVPMPPDATHVCVIGDIDSLAHDWTAFEHNLAELGYEAAVFKVQYYAWPRARYRFDARRRAFLAVAEEAK